MPVVCRIVPNRSKRREFTVEDVARIACRLIQDGTPPKEIFEAIRECAPEEKDCEEERKKLERLLELAVTALAFGISVLQFFLPIGRVLGWVSRIPFISKILGRFAAKGAETFEDLLQKSVTLRPSTTKLEGTLDFIISEAPELVRLIALKL